MAHRRGGFSRQRRGKRTATWWADLALETVAVDTGAAGIRVLALFQPVDEDEKITIGRIVGAVYVGLQAASIPRDVYWGIYTAPVGGTSLLLDPKTSSNVSSENWLHWRPVYQTDADTDSAPVWDDTKIDIRVKRKLDPTTLLQFSVSAGVAFSSAVSLRGLFMQSQS